MKTEMKITLALAGNPNSGKTTLFNNMTGARQHVGNYPGVTVEKKEGSFLCSGQRIRVVDLPGTYSLTAYSAEELVARDYLLSGEADAVICVVDASNLERNLYLALQIMELGLPVVVAANMADAAKARGQDYDFELLSRRLGVPVVSTVGHRNIGTEDLIEAALRAARSGIAAKAPEIHFEKEIEEALDALCHCLESRGLGGGPGGGARWTALKLLENDAEVEKRVGSEEVLSVARAARKRIGERLGESAEMRIADARYGYISGVCKEALRTTAELRLTRSERVDSIVMHRILGIPIFLGLMYFVFWLTFTVGGPPMDWIDGLFGWLGDTVSSWWPEGSESVLKSLLVDGVIAGVGGVVIFLPNIMLLFLAISVLEDSGYMARVAFIMDKLMHRIGLHGKSFIPLLTGFGCSIPAIMATRTLENKRDRLATMLVVPLASCGARLPIYVLIIPAFFPESQQANMLWLIYLIGIVLAILVAKLLRSTLLKGESEPFVMELPPYRTPAPKSVLIHMWDRSWLYLKKAGTVILAISIILWALTSFPKTEIPEDSGLTAEEVQSAELSHTVAGRIGHAMEPAIKPLGFDWRIGTAMIGAFAAKEVFVAQMGIVYSVGEADAESDSLREKLRANYSPLVGFCIMLFMLISAPCMATIAVTRRESNSWKWALLQLGGLTALAYGVTFLVFQVGSLMGIGV
jgi:ferrous iron transport protein B